MFYTSEKFALEQATKVERGSSYTLSSTSALDGMGCQRHAPAALPLWKTRYRFGMRLGGTQSRTGAAKLDPPPGFDPRTFQPLTRRYTYWDISALFTEISLLERLHWIYYNYLHYFRRLLRGMLFLLRCYEIQSSGRNFEPFVKARPLTCQMFQRRNVFLIQYNSYCCKTP